MSSTTKERTVAEWRAMFNRINIDCILGGDEDQYVPLTDEPWENVEYYAEQIWCITNEGDLSRKKCQEIAEQICKPAPQKSMWVVWMSQRIHDGTVVQGWLGSEWNLVGDLSKAVHLPFKTLMEIMPSCDYEGCELLEFHADTVSNLGIDGRS